jgi:hypothetical protein
MVTGSTDPLLAREALELGALAYVDKPFDFAYSSGLSSWRSGQIRNSPTYECRVSLRTCSTKVGMRSGGADAGGP